MKRSLFTFIIYILPFLLITISCKKEEEGEPGTETRLYAAITNDDGLHIYDIEDHLSPEKVGHIPGYIFEDIEIRDSILFVSCDYLDAQVMAINIADLSNPELHGSLAVSGGNGRGLLLNGCRLYLIANGLHVLDISDIDSLRVVSSTGFHVSGGEQIAFHNGDVYIANGDQGLSIYGIAEDSFYAKGFYYEVNMFPYQVAFINDSYFLMTGFLEGLKYLSCYEPEHPICFGGLSLQDGYIDVFPEGVAIVNDYAYVTSNVYDQANVEFTDMELDVIQINEGIDMQLIKRLRYPVESTRNPTGIISVFGTYLSVLRGNQGVIIFDIFDPENPEEVVSIDIENPNAIELFLR